jgi:hypothetical protein
VALVVEEDVPPDPRDVGVLGAPAVVASAQSATDAIEQPRLRGIELPSRRADMTLDRAQSDGTGYKSGRLP